MPAGLISGVAAGSLAARAGLEAGDHLLSINRQPIRDVIDVRVHAADDRLSLRALRGEEVLDTVIDRRYGESLGLEFATPTFDGIRRCDNRCEFCFLSQLPRGLRSSLYVRDDDYRYSFLFGNFVTLSCLDEDDWTRIAEQCLSPLYVSVHATDPELRRRILGNPAAPDVLEQFQRLAEIGIEVHAQIVVIPGVNDGAVLDASLADLAALYPTVISVSVVPVGITRYHRGGCRLNTMQEKRRVHDQVRSWQQRLLPSLRVRFAYLSDEWYLSLGETVPLAEEYDGLDLRENGVGAVRRFLDGASQSLRTLHGDGRTYSLVTGTLFAPVLDDATHGCRHLRVHALANRFFGDTVTVAGLLTGQDVVAQLDVQDVGDCVVLPPQMFGGPEDQTLDGMRPESIAESLGCPVVVGFPSSGTGPRVGTDAGRCCG